MNTPLLSMHDVSTSIGGHPVLHDISLDIHDRLVTTIIGPSGGGKTTLLRTINLLRTPDKGKIVFKGKAVFEGSDRDGAGDNWSGLFLNGFSEAFRGSGVADNEYRRHFGMVFQDYNLWPNLTIYDNIAAPLRWSLHLGDDEIASRIEEYANIVKISHLLSKYPHETSGGERQRSAIARALVTKPDILLLDEVTSALDVELASEILKLILNLKELGHTMILVTHHLQFAERISDVVVFLSDGRVTEKGDAKELFSNPNTPKLQRFIEHLRM